MTMQMVKSQINLVINIVGVIVKHLLNITQI